MLRIAFGLGLLAAGLWANWHIWSVTGGAAFAWNVTTWPVLFHNIWVDPLGYAQVIYSLAILPPVLGLIFLLGGRKGRHAPRRARAASSVSGTPKGWRLPTEGADPEPAAEPHSGIGDEDDGIGEEPAASIAQPVELPEIDAPERRGARAVVSFAKTFFSSLRNAGRVATPLQPFLRQVSADVREIFGGDLEGIRRIRDRARRGEQLETSEASVRSAGGLGRLFRRDREEGGRIEAFEPASVAADPAAEILEEVLAWFTVWSQTHRDQRSETMRRRAAELLAALTPELRNRLSDEHGMRGITILHTLGAAIEKSDVAEEEGGLAEPVPQPSTEDLMEETNRLYAAGAEAKTGPAFSDDDRPKTPELRDAEAPMDAHEVAKHVSGWGNSKIKADPDEDEGESDPIAKFSKMGETPEGMIAGLEMKVSPDDEDDQDGAESAVISFGLDDEAEGESDGSSVIVDDDFGAGKPPKRDGGQPLAQETVSPASADQPTLISWRGKMEADARAAQEPRPGEAAASADLDPLTEGVGGAQDADGEEDGEEAATLNTLMGGIAGRVERVSDAELREDPVELQSPASTVVSAEKMNAVLNAYTAQGLVHVTGGKSGKLRRTEQNYIRAGLAALQTRDDFVPALWEVLQQVVRYQSMVHAAEHLDEPYPQEFSDPARRADHLFRLVTAIVSFRNQIAMADIEALIELKADTEEARWLKNRRAEKLMERFQRQGAVEPCRAPAKTPAEAVPAGVGNDTSVDVSAGPAALALGGEAHGQVQPGLQVEAGEKGETEGLGEAGGAIVEGAGEVGMPGENRHEAPVDLGAADQAKPEEDWIDGATRLAVESRMAVRRDLKFSPRSEGAEGLPEEDRMIDLVAGRRIAEKNTVLAAERIAVINRIKVPAGKWTLVVRDGSPDSGSRCFLVAADGEGEISLRDGGFRLVQRIYKGLGLATECWLLVELDPAAETFDLGEAVDPEELLSACLFAMAEANVRVSPWTADDWSAKIDARIV